MKLLLRFLIYLFAIAGLLGARVTGLRAQEGPQGPMEAPAEHHVSRIGTEPEPPAPPSLPVEEIIRRFSQKEDEYLKSRSNYGFRKSVRIQEFGPDGGAIGEFLRVTEYQKLADGRVAMRAIEKPQSTLQGVYLAPEDLDALDRIPAYPLTSGQLAKYDLKFIGRELVDEVDCYIFQVKPRMVERAKAYFEGVVWVDAQYLEVVKTYGKWVTEQGDTRGIAQLPFSLFETYRENVDGKYWFPNYLRSDDTLHTKEGDIPVRLVIKWTDFKPAGAAQSVPTASPSPSGGASPASSPGAAPAPPAAAGPDGSAKPRR
ncbi:MAG TPA: hypothetical protein VN850_04235 [Candidatus Acidoferrales bacterium]|jgi:hypothetical protein|nr:hypothetical protein [Candidatus Acidoferrales bacterium]